MKDFFIELLEYGHHFNQKLASLLVENSNSVTTLEKSVSLYSHIVNAHHVWNNRIELREKPFGIWQVHPPEIFHKMDKSNLEHSLDILNKYDLEHEVSFTTTKGQPFKNSVREILFQVINHSTYHRGQIANSFRHAGLEPLLTDYIVYTWSRGGGKH